MGPRADSRYHTGTIELYGNRARSYLQQFDSGIISNKAPIALNVIYVHLSAAIFSLGVCAHDCGDGLELYS